MQGIRVALVLATIALMAAGSAVVGNYAQETLDRYFRIEFQVTPAFAAGGDQRVVYNMRAGDTADRMSLSIERLNASGQVIGSSTTWVLGGVPPGTRAYFSARVEPAASYRIQILSFDWVGRGV